MPPLNFDRLRTFVESVKDDEGLERVEDSEAEEWFTQLSQFDAENESDADRLSDLFNAAKTIMEYKDLQCSATMQQTEESEKEAAAREEELNEKNEKLQEEISTLRMNMTAGSTGLDVKALRDEIESLREENERMKYDERERLRELADEQNKSERYLSQITDLEKDVKDLRDQRFDLMNKIDELNRRLKAYEEGQDGSRSQNEQLQRRMQELRSQLLSQVDELTNLTSSNESLKNQVDKLKEDLSEATSQMDITTDQNLRLKEVLREADYTIERLKQDLTDLRGQPQDGSGANNEFVDLVAAVDKKIEHWKGLLHKKDEELAAYKKEVEQLRREITEYSIDTDRVSVAALTKAVDDREKQIGSLKKKLEDATEEMLETAELVKSLQAQLQTGGSVSSMQKKKQADVVFQAKQSSKLIAEANERADKAEQAAADRDKQYSDLITRMKQYEQGIYGLSEAVDQIKHLNEQTGIRDKQIADLNQKCSRLQSDCHEISEENDELRDRLGLDKRVKLEKTRKKGREVQQETERAMNIILQREVDKLEDERIDLKMQIRKLSQKLGQRAVALGLSADDILAIEQFTEELKHRREVALNRLNMARQGMDATVLSQEATFEEGSLLSVTTAENRELRTKLAEVETENTRLVVGVRQLKDQIRKSETDTLNPVVEAIDRILLKSNSGKIDVGMADAELKAQLEQMTGRLEETRLELQRTQDNLQQTRIDCRNAETEVSRLEDALKDAEGQREEGTLRYGVMHLPEGLPQTSHMVIMNLNEQLIQLLQESEVREEQCEKAERAAQTSQSKIAVLRHCQGLIYQEFNEAKNSWDKEKQELHDKCKSMQDACDEAAVTAQDYKMLCETLERSETEINRRFGEMSRKFTVMRINERKLIRKYRDLEQTEVRLRQEQNKLRRETLDMETSLKKKVAYLQKQKEISYYEMASLHKQLEGSVPLKDFKEKEKELEDLAIKHRSLMDEYTKVSKLSKQDSEADLLLKKYERECTYLKKILQVEKEKCVKLEAANQLKAINGLRTEESDAVGSFSARMAMLEMKELNERERAEHAQRMYETKRNELSLLEERNLLVERKVEELSQANLDLQKTDQELREELAGCVPKSVDAANRQHIEELETRETGLLSELDSLKMVTDVAKAQSEYWHNMERIRHTELYELRIAVRDFQSDSDEKSVIARLHKELIHFKLEEKDNDEKLRIAHSRLADLEARLLKAEQRYDNKERQMHNLRTNYIHRLNQAKKTISTLRARFGGAVSLKEQEQLQRSLQKIQHDRERTRAELIDAMEKTEEAEEQLEKARLKQEGLEELTATLQSTETAQKLSDWHGKLETLRLSEMKLKRKLQKSQDKCNLSETEMTKLETEVTKLEAQNVALLKESEIKEMQWETREAILEGQLNQHMEASQWEEKELTETEITWYGLPDPSLALFEQLQFALMNLRKQIKANSLLRQEVKQSEERLQDSEEKRKRLKTEVITKDKLSFHVQALIPKEGTVVSSELASISESAQKDMKEAMTALEAMVQALKVQLLQKEETAESYKRLLRSVKKELDDAEIRHQTELREARASGQSDVQDRLRKMKEESDALVHRLNAPDEAEKQLTKIAELEDTVVEQENAITSLVERMKQLKSEKEQLIQQKAQQIHLFDHSLRRNPELESAAQGSETGPKRKRPVEPSEYDDDFEEDFEYQEQKPTTTQMKPAEAQKHRSDERFSTSTGKSEGTTTDSTKRVSRVSKTSTAGFGITRPGRGSEEASLQWKVKYDRLKKQADELKTENQGLNRALLDLKNTMATATMRPSGTTTTGMKDLEIKELRMKLQELEDKLERQKDNLRKERFHEEELSSEMKELKADITRKDAVIGKLKQEKLSLEKENEALERRIGNLRESMKYKILESENRELKKKVTVLEKKSRNAERAVAEKPFEDSHDKGSSAVVKWEEGKKWQRIAEKNKEKLTEKNKELEEKQLLIDRLRQRIGRLEQERAYDSKKIHADEESPTRKASTKTLPVSGSQTSQLEKENRELRAEVAKLRLRHSPASQSGSGEKDVARMQAQNLRLQESCASLEQRLEQLTESANSTFNILDNGTTETTRDLETLIGLLRRVLTESQNENCRLEAKCKTLEEQISSLRSVSNADETLLKSLNEDIEMLRDENESLKQELDVLVSRPGTIETINRQHATIEKLEAERADLYRQLEEIRLNSARITDADVQNIVRENKELRDKISRQAPRVAWAEEFRMETTSGSSQEKISGKLVSENHRLSRELRKEQVENLSLKQQLWETKESTEKLEAEIKRIQHLNSQKRKWSPGSFSSRVLEEQLKAKESMLEYKESRIEQLEHLLREEVDRSHKYLFENKRMKEKLQAFEWIPSRSMGYEDYGSEIRKLKVQLANTTTENLELKAEVEVLNRYLKPAMSASNELDPFALKERLKNYERVLKENVELKLQCRQ